jgi:hypothetical protein
MPEWRENLFYGEDKLTPQKHILLLPFEGALVQGQSKTVIVKE